MVFSLCRSVSFAFVGFFITCLVLGDIPCVQATWSWIFPPRVKEMVPEICGLKVILGNHVYNSSFLSVLQRDTEDRLIRFELPEAPPSGPLHAKGSDTSPE